MPLSMRAQTVAAAVIIALGAGLWVAREPVSAAVIKFFKPKEAEQRAGRGRRGGVVPVVVGQVGEGRNDLRFAGVGTGRAISHVTLYPAVSGEIREVLVKTGDRVTKGQAIVRLDDRQARLAVDLARSRLDGAQRLLERAEQLNRRNVQSMAQVLDARTAVEQAQVGLRTAEVALEDHTIEAPFDGVLGIPRIDIGDRVSPTTPLVTLDDRSKLVLEFDIPEHYLPRLKRGMALEVRTPGFPRRTFEGRIGGIDSRVDPARRTFVARAEVDNADDLLRPGMSFAIDLLLAGEMFPKVPDLALQFANDGNYVWLVEDGTAKRVKVEIVKRVSDAVLVAGPLALGAPIVLEGVQRLRPGRKVEVADGERLAPPPAEGEARKGGKRQDGRESGTEKRSEKPAGTKPASTGEADMRTKARAAAGGNRS